MEQIIHFFRDTLDGPVYIVVAIIAGILLCACIGYLAEKSIKRKKALEEEENSSAPAMETKIAMPQSPASVAQTPMSSTTVVNQPNVTPIPEMPTRPVQTVPTTPAPAPTPVVAEPLAQPLSEPTVVTEPTPATPVIPTITTVGQQPVPPVQPVASQPSQEMQTPAPSTIPSVEPQVAVTQAVEQPTPMLEEKAAPKINPALQVPTISISSQPIADQPIATPTPVIENQSQIQSQSVEPQTVATPSIPVVEVPTATIPQEMPQQPQMNGTPAVGTIPQNSQATTSNPTSNMNQ